MINAQVLLESLGFNTIFNPQYFASIVKNYSYNIFIIQAIKTKNIEKKE